MVNRSSSIAQSLKLKFSSPRSRSTAQMLSVTQMLKLTFKMSLRPKNGTVAYFDFHNFIVYLNLNLKCIAGAKPSKFKVGIVWA